MALSTFTMLYNHHLYLVPKHCVLFCVPFFFHLAIYPGDCSILWNTNFSLFSLFCGLLLCQTWDELLWPSFTKGFIAQLQGMGGWLPEAGSPLRVPLRCWVGVMLLSGSPSPWLSNAVGQEPCLFFHQAVSASPGLAGTSPALNCALMAAALPNPVPSPFPSQLLFPSVPSVLCSGICMLYLQSSNDWQRDCFQPFALQVVLNAYPCIHVCMHVWEYLENKFPEFALWVNSNFACKLRIHVI